MNGINRRQFLSHSGTFITVPILLNTLGPFLKPLMANSRMTIPDELNIPILKALGIGISAPNPHNTQAWKFKILSDYECLLYVDETRLLPETDPPARQIHIGQGTFLETLVIGAAGLGFDSEINYFPEGYYDLSEIGIKPVAHIKLIKSVKITEDSLHDSLPKRQTNRTPYTGPVITQAEFDTIHTMVKLNGIKLGFINNANEIEKLNSIFLKAMEIETNTYRLYDETKIWFRFNDQEIEKNNDGLSLGSNGMSGLMKWFAEKFFLSRDSWHSESNKKAGLNNFQKAVESSRGFVYIQTDTNNQLDWVKAGRAYTRLNLAATKLGPALHPMSQVQQEYPEMKETQAEFNSLLDVKEPGKIQMVARLGRSAYRYDLSRRSVNSMLIR